MAGLAGLEAKGDLVARAGAVDLQDAVLELRVLLEAARPALRGHDPGRAGDDGGHGCELLDAHAVIHVNASPLE